MKKVKKEGGAGLQEWLSYQSRTREVIQPETDIIDWDEGIEVQEEWLPREQCEQRLREEVERQLAPMVAASMPSSAPIAAAAEGVAPSEVAAPAVVAIAEVAIAEVVAAAEIVEVEDVPLTAPAAVETPSTSIATPLVTKQPETKEVTARESSREVRSKPAAPTQFVTDDLASAMPAFQR